VTCQHRMMRYVVMGAGAVGGVVGGRLHESGHDVVLVARGAHFEALRDHGLVLESPTDVVHLDVEVVDRPAALTWRDPTVVFLSVKGQDTEEALDSLAAAAPPETAIVCLQNGVENERRALRRFAHTYGMCVMLPATHLRPGLVQAHNAPFNGLLDVGCYPSGLDEVAEEIAGALSASRFDAHAVPDVMRWKYRKLLKNLANAVDSLCGVRTAGAFELVQMAQEEGEAVLAAAGVEVATPEEDDARRLVQSSLQPTASGPHQGGSSWQSVARGTGRVEADFLNGEIALVGRLVGVPTPVNELLQRLAGEAAARGAAPGSYPLEELRQAVAHAAG